MMLAHACILEKFIVILVLASLCLTDEEDTFVQDRCVRWHHASMLRGNSIFIDGGVEVLRTNETTWLGFSKYIFEIDMSDTWDANTNLSETIIGRFGDSAMGSNPPNMVRGALYRGPGNDSRLFTFGGSTFIANTTDPDWTAPSSDQFSLWSYDTTLMTWSQYDVSHAVPRRPNWGSVAEAIAAGTGFFLNGEIDRGSSNVMYSTAEYVGGDLSNETSNEITYLSGMAIIDMLSQETRNVSTDLLGSPRVSGGLVHAPRFGKSANGTLVAFGGMRSSNTGIDTFSNGIMVGFETVSLCDTFMEESVTWVNQSTTGDIPPPRLDFCTLPAPKSAPDNSSHHLSYIYGGYNPGNGTMYDDVYILSLPSFTWAKAYSGQTPRFGHTCHTAGTRQMMTVGGSLNASLHAIETSGNIPNLSTLACDTKPGVMVFDLTELTWGTVFDRYAKPYEVPKMVVDVIGGSSNGSATMRQPLAGFDNPAVFTMFHPPTNTPSAIASTPTNTSRKASNPATIAGAVVGGLFGFAIIVGMTFYWLRMSTATKAHIGSVISSDISKSEKGCDYTMEHGQILAEISAEHEVKELPVQGVCSEMGAEDVKNTKCHEMFAELPAGLEQEGKVTEVRDQKGTMEQSGISTFE